MTPSSLDDSAECNTEDMAASPSSPALPSSPESPSSLEISPPSPQPIVEHDGSDAVGDAVDDSDATSAVVVSDEDFSPEDDDVIVKKKVETGENEVGTNSVSHTFCWEEEKDREVERECHDSAYPDRWGTIVPTGAESMPLDDDGEDLVQSPELVEISPHHDRLESEGTLPQSERTVGLLGAEATVEKTVGRDGDGVASNNDGQNEQSIEGESVKNFEKNHKQEEEEIDQDSQGENRGKNMVDLPIVELASPLKDVDDLAAEPEIMLHQNLTDDRSNGNVFLQVSSHEKSKDNDDDDGSKDRRDNEVMEANLDSAVVSKDYNNNDILLPSSLSENTRFENEMVEINTEVEEATVTAPQLVSPLPDSGDAILKIEEKGKDRNTKDIIHQKSMKKDSQMMRKKDLMELEPDDEVIAAEITNNPDQDKEVAEKEQIEKEGESEMIRTMTASQQQIDNPSESTIQEHEEIEEEIFNKNIMINPVKEINFLNFQDNSSFSTQQGNENDNSNDVSKNEVSNKTSNENYDRNDCDDEEYEQDDNCSLEDADDAGKDDDTDSDDDEEPEPILYYHVHRPTINSSIVCHGPHHLFAYVESNDREKRPDGNSSKTATGVQNVCITQLLSVQMPPSSVAANDQSKDSKNPPRTDAITLCLPSLLEPPQVQPHHQKPLPSPDSSDIDSFEITALSFHYPSATLLSACASDGRGCLYRLSLLTSPVHCPRSRYGPVMGAYHPLLNSAASCTSVTRFDLNTSTLRGPRGGVTCSALDPSSDGMGREGGGQSPQDDVGLAVGYGDGTLALHRIMEERIGLRWRPWSRLESFAEKSVSSEAERRLGRLKFTVVLWSGGAEGAATPDAASRAVTGIMWTGSVLAFSSCTSVKVIDPSTGARLARVERPSGATPGLHHLSMQMQLKIPRMVWEGDPDNDGCSGGLWIAWGHTVACVRRDGKTAEAFEVDGVACGAVPFDKGHMAVLAQMAVWEDTGSPVTMGEDSKDNSKREVVIQTRMLLVDRRTGEPISSDVLPLDVSADSNRHHQRVVLTSSYVAAYRRQGESTIEDSHDLVETLALPSAHDGRGSDPAGHWNAVLTLRLDGRGKEMLPSPLSESDEGVDDAKMNDDDPTQYDAYLRPSIPLPLMTISVPGFPTVVVRVRDVDDAVAYSFQFGRPREAVERALRGRRALRSTTFEQVVEEYLDTLVQSNCSRKKGAQRVHEAAAATEILLGNDNDVWERWVKIFGKVKGGMVALWPYMPVRDPKLPPKVYEIALKHMFNDTLEILACESGKFTNPLIARAAKDQLLNAIRSWGKYDFKF
uniref:Uncharacterized protein n=1 Tax=Corethron hystrix TaxID=216773 RepID=A0A7S1BCJ4_9STRA|mmetsp:Transcript_22024/g.50261  ORF Transcript_22024/g.50261 Transcript_22024/m.50261 type:complete len:1304 (+) Transcript_22024:236-4147(+)